MQSAIFIWIAIVLLFTDVSITAFKARVSSTSRLNAFSKSAQREVTFMSTADSVPYEAKSFLKTFLSSRSNKDTKNEMYEQIRQLRMQNNSISPIWDTFFDSLVDEVRSVEGNKWAMRRWLIPLPSYRIKLGAFNRMWKQLVEQEKELVQRSGSAQTERETQRRALGVLLGQLRTTAGIRRLEKESIQRKKREGSIEEMLDRTPKGLETPSYKVLHHKKTWEVRQYDSFSVCSLSMMPSPTDNEGDTAPAAKQGTVGGGAFNSLAGYIFGKNQEAQKMAMTTPVITSGSRSRMSFVMPSNYWGNGEALQKAPRPVDGSGVVLQADGGGLVAEEQPAVAVKWFGGYANKVEAERMAKELREAIVADGRYEVGHRTH